MFKLNPEPLSTKTYRAILLEAECVRPAILVCSQTMASFVVRLWPGFQAFEKILVDQEHVPCDCQVLIEYMAAIEEE